MGIQRVPVRRYTPRSGDLLEIPFGYDDSTIALVKVTKSGYETDGSGGVYIAYQVVDPLNWPEPLRVGQRGLLLVRDGEEEQMDEVILRKAAERQAATQMTILHLGRNGDEDVAWKVRDYGGRVVQTGEYSIVEFGSGGDPSAFQMALDRRLHQVRRATIRLAHEKPELRPHLLPLLQRTAGNRQWARLFPRGSYLNRFFEEKDIPSRVFTVKDRSGLEHMIPNGVVVEYIASRSRREQEQAAEILRKIDFHNGDVNHFLKHMAGAVAESYAGALRG